MELRHLEVFVAVVREKGFTRAAETLGLSQPTVSLHLQSLERELGVKLLDRDGRKISLTPAGKIFYSYAKEIVDLAEKALLEVKRFLGSVEGTFTIGASTVPGEYILPRMLPNFIKEYPNTRFIVRVMDSEKVNLAVAEGDLDMGVVGGSMEDDRLQYDPLCEDEVVLIASEDLDVPDVLELGDLSKVPLVIREEGSGTRKAFVKALESMGFDFDSLKVVAIVESTTAVKEAVKHKLGCGIVSKLSVEDELKKGILRVVRINNLKVIRKFLIVTKRNRTLAPAIELFRNYLIKESH